jgi:hypothetical protein
VFLCFILCYIVCLLLFHPCFKFCCTKYLKCAQVMAKCVPFFEFSIIFTTLETQNRRCQFFIKTGRVYRQNRSVNRKCSQFIDLIKNCQIEIYTDFDCFYQFLWFSMNRAVLNIISIFQSLWHVVTPEVFFMISSLVGHTTGGRKSTSQGRRFCTAPIQCNITPPVQQ